MVWRGWFYTNDHVDISIDNVNWFKINTGNPDIENPIAKEKKEKNDTYIGNSRNKSSISKTITEIDQKSVDFYTTYDPFKTNILDRDEYNYYINSLDDEEKEILNSNKNYYEIQFSNIGGLVMPIILKFNYIDGTSETIRITQKYGKEILKLFLKFLFLIKK